MKAVKFSACLLACTLSSNMALYSEEPTLATQLEQKKGASFSKIKPNLELTTTQPGTEQDTDQALNLRPLSKPEEMPPQGQGFQEPPAGSTPSSNELSDQASDAPLLVEEAQSNALPPKDDATLETPPPSRELAEQAIKAPAPDFATVLKTWKDQSEILTLAQAISGRLTPTTGAQKALHVDYNAFVEQKWARLEDLSLKGALAFEQKEILAELNAQPLPENAQLFYPFGGPDIVYPLTLFPGITSYVLVGLEPCGSIEEAKLPLNYVQLKSVMGNIFNSGFFVTHKMTSNLKGFGTLPVLLGLLVKLEYTPTKVEEIKINQLQGIRIHFHNTKGEAKSVSYYSGDLTKIDPKIFGPSQVGMVKCCSYLMHGWNFPLVKNYLLKEVTYLLQDDTGIPFRELVKSKRRTILYGEYTKPYGDDFPLAKQADLAQAYLNKSNIKELGFRIGYGFGKSPSNLAFSVRLPQGEKLP